VNGTRDAVSTLRALIFGAPRSRCGGKQRSDYVCALALIVWFLLGGRAEAVGQTGEGQPRRKGFGAMAS